MLVHIFPLLGIVTGVTPAAVYQHCKPIASSPDWPSVSQWQALNASVCGRLSAVNPPGAVCHSDQPNFNNASCASVSAQWSNSSWHASNPWSTDYNDEACLPSPLAPCSKSGYPAYAIEAINSADVQKGVLFANNTGVRLVIKGTGHDYPGRSQGRNSLEIWTHKLRGATVNLNDPIAVSAGAVGSMKIAAGMRWGEIYAEAVKHNVTVVGGADLDVGVGGWIMNGGHSPVSNVFGLGADQILEMEVVTADGEHRIINEATEADLFWAVRGGGGSTYAVMVSVTVKVYESLPGTNYILSYNTTASSDTFWSMVAYFNSQLPELSELGAMGYYWMLANTSTLFGGDPKSAIVGIFTFPKRTAQEVKAIMSPLENNINRSKWATDQISMQNYTLEFPDFMSFWLNNSKEDVGSAGRLGSWLLNGEALKGDFDTLKTQLRKAAGSSYMLGHLVAGPGVRNAKIPGGSNAVLPAWRRAYTHMVTPGSWEPFDASGKAAVTKMLREDSVPALKALAPHSGAYINEADPSNPEWQNDYFGENYPRLLEIKQKWDPRGVFWCKPCVGHELWDIVDGPKTEDKLEWGIGQGEGRICRKQT